MTQTQPQEFYRIQQEIKFVGIAFARDQQEMQRVARTTRKLHNCKVRTHIIPEVTSKEIKPRYLLLLPEGAPQEIKDSIMSQLGDPV